MPLGSRSWPWAGSTSSKCPPGAPTSRRASRCCPPTRTARPRPLDWTRKVRRRVSFRVRQFGCEITAQDISSNTTVASDGPSGVVRTAFPAPGVRLASGTATRSRSRRPASSSWAAPRAARRSRRSSRRPGRTCAVRARGCLRLLFKVAGTQKRDLWLYNFCGTTSEVPLLAVPVC